MSENIASRNVHEFHIVPVLISAFTIPISMSLWIINTMYARIFSSDNYDEPEVIPPSRWLISCIIPIIIIIYGYRRKSLSKSGCALAFIVGFMLTLSSYCFFACLLTFFITSSKATKYKDYIKKKTEEEFKEGGQRNWVQVLCNGGMVTQLAFLYLLDVGSSERTIDFVKDYRASWLSMGILGALAASNGDTWASELGVVLSNSDPFLVTTFKCVPKGTNGGISIIGTILSFIGGLVIGIAYYLVVLFLVDENSLRYAPPQWPIVFVGAFAGFLGSMLDSILGATLQYTGIDKDGKITSQKRLAVKDISGWSILDNNSVNLISTVVIALTLPILCNLLWPV